MKINGIWVLDHWGFIEGRKVLMNEEGIELNSNVLYEIVIEYFNSKVYFLFKIWDFIKYSSLIKNFP